MFPKIKNSSMIYQLNLNHDHTHWVMSHLSYLLLIKQLVGSATISLPVLCKTFYVGSWESCCYFIIHWAVSSKPADLQHWGDPSVIALSLSVCCYFIMMGSQGDGNRPVFDPSLVLQRHARVCAHMNTHTSKLYSLIRRQQTHLSWWWISLST